MKKKTLKLRKRTPDELKAYCTGFSMGYSIGIDYGRLGITKKEAEEKLQHLLMCFDDREEPNHDKTN